MKNEIENEMYKILKEAGRYNYISGKKNWNNGDGNDLDKPVNVADEFFKEVGQLRHFYQLLDFQLKPLYANSVSGKSDLIEPFGEESLVKITNTMREAREKLKESYQLLYNKMAETKQR